MNLHKVKHGPKGNRWCGPSALAAISNRQTDYTVRILRRITKRRQITGTGEWAMLTALHQMGYGTRQVFWAHRYYAAYRKHPTLAAWLRVTKRPAGKVFLVDAGNHWQVISGRRYVCGRTIEIVSVRDKRVKRRSRVEAAWEVFKYDEEYPHLKRRAA